MGCVVFSSLMADVSSLGVITARIRRMTEGNVFTLSTIAGGGGVTLSSWWGGYPHPVPMGGTPSFLMGGTPPSGWQGYPIWLTGGTHLAGGGCPGYTSIRTGWGYPPSELDGNTPCQNWMGTPHQDWMEIPLPIRTGWGYPLHQDWMGVRAAERALALRMEITVVLVCGSRDQFAGFRNQLLL